MKPVKIHLIMTGGRQWTGGIEYIRNIVKASNRAIKSGALDRQFEITLIIRGDVESQYYDDLREQVQHIKFIKNSRWNFLKYLLQNDAQFIYPYVRSKVWQPKVPSAAWIPDFQHKFLPQFFTQAELKFRDELYHGVSKFSNHLILSSETARKHFEKFYPQHKCKIDVLKFRTVLDHDIKEADARSILEKYHLPEKYFLVSNQWWRHKNHEIILKALTLIKDANITVVCTGHPYDSRNPSHIDHMLNLTHSYDLSRNIKILGLIPRSDQLHIMSKSTAVIQPSQFEGWSTVIEDARSLAKPVIASAIDVHVEQLGSSGYFFEAGDQRKLSQLILQLWQNPPTQSPELLSDDLVNFGTKFLTLYSKDV